MSKANEIKNLLRSINSHSDLQVAIDTLESVVYNFENPECSCDYLRDAAPDEVKAYEQATMRLTKSLDMMMEK